jgi:excinuclease UvrABC nuclease subunit
MEHNYINVENKMKSFVLNQKDNNLDKQDNLDELPTDPAVYAICSQVNGKAANARYVGETNNLQQAIKSHFDKNVNQPTDCFKEFMQSIKTKNLVYETLPDASEEERSKLKKTWEVKFDPRCNEELNKIH